MTNEEFYDDEVAPVLLDLAKKLQDRGMSLLFTVEIDSETAGTTCALTKGHGLGIEWAHVAAKCNGNADILIGYLAKQANERGHGSIFLRQLGISETTE